MPQEQVNQHTTALGAKIHPNIWGPVQTKTIGGKNYYISFTDDHSHKTKMYLLEKRSKAFDKYCEYEAYLHAQRDVHIKVLQTN